MLDGQRMVSSRSCNYGIAKVEQKFDSATLKQTAVWYSPCVRPAESFLLYDLRNGYECPPVQHHVQLLTNILLMYAEALFFKWNKTDRFANFTIFYVEREVYNDESG